MYDTDSHLQGSIIQGKGHSGSIQELRYTGPGDQNSRENAIHNLQSLQNITATLAPLLWHTTLLVAIRRQLSYLQQSYPVRGCLKGWIPGLAASRYLGGNCWPMKMICGYGGQFLQGFLELVVALGSCFLSDKLTSKSLWRFYAASVKVKRLRR